MSIAETQRLINTANTAFQRLQENNAAFIRAIGGWLEIYQNNMPQDDSPTPPQTPPIMENNIDQNFNFNFNHELENLANELNFPEINNVLQDNDGGDIQMEFPEDFDDLPNENENENELYWNDIALEFQDYAELHGLYENDANVNNESIYNMWAEYLNETWEPDSHQRISSLGDHCDWVGVFPVGN
jgi:hypothetical protein